MVRKNKWVVMISLAVALTPFALAQSAPQHKSHHKSRKLLKAVELPPLPSGPLPQVPLDQLPSVPPQVSYQNGNLSIIAQNSTLGDILREVRKSTGASIDVPGNANERVATRLGPGPARDVLATLLNGTSFNYVMVGSNTDPAALSSIVLTSKPAASGTETAQNQPAQAYMPAERADFGPGTGRPPGFVPPQPMVPQPMVQQVQAIDGGDTADNADEENPDDNADQDQQADAEQGDQPQPVQPGLPNAGPKTPQQILQMLQRGQNPQQVPQNSPPNVGGDQQQQQ